MTARVLMAGAGGSASRILAERLRQAYFSVSLQSDEAAAATRLLEWQPDVIVFECAPEDSDLTGFQRLRGQAAGRHTPTLLLCAATEPAARLRGLQLGAEDVLGVPLDIELLTARLHAVLRPHQLRDRWRIRREDLPDLRLATDAALPSSVAGARALLVDDDDSSLAALRDALDREGVASGSAATAGQAANLCAAMDFDLIVVNLALLTGDPLRLVAELRAADATRHVPLLLLAAPALRSQLLRGLALGADDWLAWRPDTVQSVAELRARAGNRLRQKFRQDRLCADLAHALEMALIDPLTGCDNRRHLGRKLQALLAAAPENGLALLLIDIDGFKVLNERLGYAAADHVLVQLADLLRQASREMDSVGRLGGEEFVVLMPGRSIREAKHVADQLRRSVRSLIVPGGDAGVTVSIGVAGSGHDPCGGPTTPERLLHQARQALDMDRRRGGDAVASPAQPQEPAAAL